MDGVGRVVPALPVSLVSTALLEAGENPLTLLELKGQVSNLISQLEASGAYVHIPRADRDYAIDVGLRMLKLRHLILESDEGYCANPQELPLLQYYANAIAHLFASAPSQVVALAEPSRPAPIDTFEDRLRAKN
jgi:glycerol-3-phosphate O-acyltransferase